MKLIKLERISTIRPSIVRITYKTWYGKTKVRDAMRKHDWWHFVDDDDMIYYHDHYISEFMRSDLNIYVINEQTFIPPPPKQLPRIIKEDKR